MTPRLMAVPDITVALRKAWEELDERVMNNLVESMPDRLAAVIEAKGGNTKY